jgi:hypothetical protein
MSISVEVQAWHTHKGDHAIVVGGCPTRSVSPTGVLRHRQLAGDLAIWSDIPGSIEVRDCGKRQREDPDLIALEGLPPVRRDGFEEWHRSQVRRPAMIAKFSDAFRRHTIVQQLDEDGPCRWLPLAPSLHVEEILVSREEKESAR